MRQEQYALGAGLNMRKAGSLHNDSNVDGQNVSTYTEFSPSLADAMKLSTLSEQVGSCFGYTDTIHMHICHTLSLINKQPVTGRPRP